jgi:hypothetical protein
MNRIYQGPGHDILACDAAIPTLYFYGLQLR